jgi:hypothetical protein
MIGILDTPPLGICGAAELRVVVGRDIGELAGDGAVVNDGKDVRDSALVAWVRRRQLARVELLVTWNLALHDIIYDIIT